MAKAAGVSVATVSRVLNNKAKVNEDLTRRVMDAVKSLHYEPNPIARSLRRNESQTILILAPNITNPYYTHIIAGIGAAARSRGYSAFLCDTEGEAQQERKLLERMERRQADGAIMLAAESETEWLQPFAEKYPIVQCSEYDPSAHIVHVAIDNYRAAREVMDYLLELDHRKIGIISSENHYCSTRQRTQGYRDALTAAGIPVNEDYIVEATADYSFKSGFAAARSMLSQEERPTALFCISDVLALGAIAGAQDMGFRVPEDVTVIGFDDVEHTTMFHPYITTVVQPCYDIGYQAMELLYALMRGEKTQEQILLPHSLIVRESSAPRHQDTFMDFTARVSSR